MGYGRGVNCGREDGTSNAKEMGREGGGDYMINVDGREGDRWFVNTGKEMLNVGES